MYKSFDNRHPHTPIEKNNDIEEIVVSEEAKTLPTLEENKESVNDRQILFLLSAFALCSAFFLALITNPILPLLRGSEIKSDMEPENSMLPVVTQGEEYGLVDTDGFQVIYPSKDIATQEEISNTLLSDYMEKDELLLELQSLIGTIKGHNYLFSMRESSEGAGGAYELCNEYGEMLHASYDQAGLLERLTSYMPEGEGVLADMETCEYHSVKSISLVNMTSSLLWEMGSVRDTAIGEVHLLGEQCVQLVAKDKYMIRAILEYDDYLYQALLKLAGLPEEDLALVCTIWYGESMEDLVISFEYASKSQSEAQKMFLYGCDFEITTPWSMPQSLYKTQGLEKSACDAMLMDVAKLLRALAVLQG